MTEPYRSEVALVRPNPVLTWMGPTLVALAAVALIAGAATKAVAIVALTPALIGVGVLATLWGARTRRGTRADAGELSIDDEAIRWGGEVLARRAQVRDGFIIPEVGRRPTLRLTRRAGRPIELRVRDEAHGREVLRALGLDVTQRVAVFRLLSRAFSGGKSFALYVGIVMAIAVLTGIFSAAFHSAASFALFRPILVLGAVAAAFATRTTLTVGADGMLISFLGKKRFIRYHDVSDVVPYEHGFLNRRWEGVRIVLRSGEAVDLACNRSGRFDEGSRSTIITQRIREALESARRGDPAQEAAVLGRNARDVTAWIRQLRGLGAGAVDLRTAPIPEDRLWRLVEDPGAPASARAGAAVALGPSLDEGGRARLRVAAEATASPKLRVALTAATREDEAALVQALEEIEEADAPTGRSARR